MKLPRAARWALAVGVAGCHRAPAPGASASTDDATASPLDAEASLLPARCRRTDVAFALDEGRGLADLEVGDGLAYPGGYAVGLVHATGAGPVAAIALLGRGRVGLTRILDLGPTLGDAPPPRIGWRPGELVAAAYVRSPEGRAHTPDAQPAREDAAREVALYTVAADQTVAAPLTVAQRRDDSLALDMAFAGPAGLLVWDEATSAPRGVVKAAAFSNDHVASGRDVSPPDSDAELPRVVPDGNGFAVVWIARRPEPGSALDGSASEATGEARTYGWLEAVVVDARGEATGPVRRLTSPAGHVSAYDVTSRPLPSGAAAALLFVARDDGEAVDGSGGTLVRVRATGDAVEPPVPFATDGLGRGAPTFVFAMDANASAAPGPLALAWVAKDEQTRLLPLDPAGAPAAPPSAEDALGEARALLTMGGAAGGAAGAADVLVATPSDSAAQLRIFACTAITAVTRR
jgi:hypothetical protein